MTQKIPKIGDKLWYVPRERYMGSPRELTVTKVGRVWFETDGRRGLRFRIDTMQADGGQYISPGRAYWSREFYELESALDAEWEKFRNMILNTRHRPESVEYIQQIQKAFETLGIKDQPQ